ncbi:hypothetical protein CASFOL_005957 [Castilleja foliolosa]|uniref:Uncharacterized protein n=1 Tax=Castilleja foliolosa TaxID=1961234 RepID=A0ABD3E8X0_9LAMI
MKMTTCTEEDPKNKTQPQLVKMNKAFKLAVQWVDNMSKSSVKFVSVELEGRPSRLGIGATVPKESRVTHSDNPIEKKLLSKLNANKKKAMRDADLAAKDGNDDEESEEEESESKTRSFGKKRPQNVNSPQPGKKKKLR